MTETVRLRIAAAVDPTGHWVAYGSSEQDSWDVLVLDDLEEGESRFWVEVELPVPDAEPSVVQAQASVHSRTEEPS